MQRSSIKWILIGGLGFAAAGAGAAGRAPSGKRCSTMICCRPLTATTNSAAQCAQVPRVCPSPEVCNLTCPPQSGHFSLFIVKPYS